MLVSRSDNKLISFKERAPWSEYRRRQKPNRGARKLLLNPPGEEPLQVLNAYKRTYPRQQFTILTFPLERKEPKIASVPPQDYQKNLPNPLQGSRRPGVTGRLLPKSGRLVLAKRAKCRSRQLRLPLVSLHQPSDPALRPVRRWQQRHFSRLERKRKFSGSRDQQRVHPGLGRRSQQAGSQTPRTQRSGGSSGLEW